MCGTGTGGKGSGQRRGAGEAWRRKQLMEGDGETMVVEEATDGGRQGDDGGDGVEEEVKVFFLVRLFLFGSSRRYLFFSFFYPYTDREASRRSKDERQSHAERHSR